MHVRGSPEVNDGYLPLLHLFLKGLLFLSRGSPFWLVASRDLGGSSCICPTMGTPLCLAFRGVLGIQAQAFMLEQKAHYSLSHPSSPTHAVFSPGLDHEEMLSPTSLSTKTTNLKPAKRRNASEGGS